MKVLEAWVFYKQTVTVPVILNASQFELIMRCIEAAFVSGFDKGMERAQEILAMDLSKK